MSIEYYQQGDLIIRRARISKADEYLFNLYKSDISDKWKQEIKRFSILEGEATGHHHEIVGKQFKVAPVAAMGRPDRLSLRYFKNNLPVTIEHPEHKPIELPPGEWEVVRVKEVDPVTGRERYIAD